MAKRTYAVSVDGLTITRNTDRTYTHAVVSGEVCQSVTVRQLEAGLKHQREELAKLILIAEGRKPVPAREAGAPWFWTAEKYADFVKSAQKIVARYEEQLAFHKARGDEERAAAAPTLHGFTGRPDLAEKLAQKARNNGYLNVRILEAVEVAAPAKKTKKAAAAK